jgi:carbon storage regulator CsrA
MIATREITTLVVNGANYRPNLQEGNLMLVLSRKTHETIVIDSDIQITVVSISASRVKIGIQAPDYVRVLRSELSPRGGDPPEVIGPLLDEPHRDEKWTSLLPR